MIVGADGCRAGWFAVVLEGQALEFHITRSFESLAMEHTGAARILVDIPIGLPKDKPRRCDSEARKLLGRRRNSVFPVPCRDAVFAEDFRTAAEINEKAMGRRITKQAWNICGKIAEVDTFLRRHPGMRDVIHESHPELCFWALAGGREMSAPKHTEAGQRERIALLSKFVRGIDMLLSRAKSHAASHSVGDDDILDALCLAVTAACPGPLPQVPAIPELDETGLEMKILFSGCCSLQRPALKET